MFDRMVETYDVLIALGKSQEIPTFSRDWSCKIAQRKQWREMRTLHYQGSLIPTCSPRKQNQEYTRQ